MRSETLDYNRRESQILTAEIAENGESHGF